MRSALVIGSILAAALVGGLAPSGRGDVGAATGSTPAEASPPTYDIDFREVWIPTRDGVKLAADIYLPKGGKAKARFPVLLEYLPYRKNESRGDRYGLYAYFVRRGYVVARVDIRGTWNSDGRLVEYEYSGRQPGDGDSVSSWLAGQPFLSVNGGMLGI